LTRVLVAEDETVVRMLVVRLLERAGYDVLQAERAPEVLPLLENNDVSLLLCDLNLPGGSGSDLLARVREQFPELPLIVVTGAATALELESAERVGIDRFVFKPFTHDEFLAAVADALEAGGRALEVDT
jgi:CheY-like chemotaxis protein